MPFVTCGHILNVLLFLQLNTPKKNWYCSTCFLLFPFNDFVNDTDFYFTIHGVQFLSSFDDSDFNPKYFNPFLEATILIHYSSILTLILTLIFLHPSLIYCPNVPICLLIKDVFSPVYDYAGNVDLNKTY